MGVSPSDIKENLVTEIFTDGHKITERAQMFQGLQKPGCEIFACNRARRFTSKKFGDDNYMSGNEEGEFD